jgi:ribose transport system ATP-binding protein
MSMSETIVSLTDIHKRFGSNHVLDGLDFAVKSGECVGLVGHNGAGKSTLMNILAGTLAIDSGEMRIGDRHVAAHSVNNAHSFGIRCVFQELSLCPNLTVAENVRVLHHSLSGWGWRRRAARLIADKLDEIFPGHGIRSDAVTSDLTLTQRQMVEIARAFTEVDAPVRLVLLDEPTSSLDSTSADQLLNYVYTATARQQSVILISHMLGEIVRAADRSVVMRDGNVVATFGRGVTKNEVVAAMGNVAAETHGRAPTRKSNAGELRVDLAVKGKHITARKGEIIGLAGLAGHGQTELLFEVFEQARRRSASVKGTVAFVAGDRVKDGVFPSWSIGANLSIGAMPGLSRAGFISPEGEAALGQAWRDRIRIKTADMDQPILSLSGGNQQKVLFARALAADSQIVLMDDPLRGVDLGTKLEVYQLIQAEAEQGRTFLWYSTELEELVYCDRVYVFRSGHMTGCFSADEFSEDKVIKASFDEVAA